MTKTSAHRLVAMTFIEPLLQGLEVDHVNSKRDDNRLENLAVVSKQENMKRVNWKSKKIEMINRVIELNSSGLTAEEIYEAIKKAP